MSSNHSQTHIRGHKSLREAFIYGCILKCPFCLKGHLFKSYLKLHTHCLHCEGSFEKADTGDGPAFFVMSIVSIFSVIFLIWLELNYTPALWIHVLSQLIIILGGCAILLPIVKSLLVHLQYYYKATQSFHR